MKHPIYMFFLTICAIMLGGLLGGAVVDTSGLSWLTYSLSFGIDTVSFNLLDVLGLTFGFTININVAQILLIIVGIMIYYKTANAIFDK